MSYLDIESSILVQRTLLIFNFIIVSSNFASTSPGTAQVGETCHPVDQCSCKFDNGQYISLWDIDSKNKYKARFHMKPTIPTNSAKYAYNPCTGFTIPNTKCKDALMCETVSNAGKTVSAIIAYSTNPQVTYDSGNYKFVYPGKSATTNIILKCDPSATTPTILDVLFLPTGNLYYTTLTSKCACPGGCSYSPYSPTPGPTKKPPPTSSSKKLSIGSILCISLLLIVVVYLVAGILLNKYHFKKEGSDVIPNKTFWAGVPFLAKDGVVYTIGKIKGNRSEYQQI